jgi:hypothetical protein
MFWQVFKILFNICEWNPSLLVLISSSLLDIYENAALVKMYWILTWTSQVVNRSSETLQNLCLELATMGDLKLVERPQNYALPPGGAKVIRANIKVCYTGMVRGYTEMWLH